MAENILDNDPSAGDQLKANLLGNTNGILSAKPIAKYTSGARCKLKVNGKIIGFAFAISWNIKTTVTEIQTIDDYLPYELAPQRIEVTGAISGFRIPGSGPTQTLIQTDFLGFLHQRYVEIEVRDTQTDNLIFFTKQAMIVGRQENVKSDALADMTLSFRSIGWLDERKAKEPERIGSIPNENGENALSTVASKLGKFIGGL